MSNWTDFRNQIKLLAIENPVWTAGVIFFILGYLAGKL